jgi:hypothetical protein
MASLPIWSYVVALQLALLGSEVIGGSMGGGQVGLKEEDSPSLAKLIELQVGRFSQFLEALSL